MKINQKIRILAFALLFGVLNAFAEYWPEKYGGVMLQGFYWESYDETSWAELTAQSDDIAAYFDLMWVPNSGKCSNNPKDKTNTNNMGYMPLYWWNHNGAFGTETQLLNMISTFKQKGLGVIADVVINHRNGWTNWTNFPPETDKKGVSWTWDVSAICNDDEVNTDPKAAGQEKATGNADTGAKVPYCRDLDHTNTHVQDGIKAYTRDLLGYYGYAGFRYDMTSGYDPQYTIMYNEAAQPVFSVGEYWVGNGIKPDAVKAWIDKVQKKSAAFDFATKFEINYAFNQNRFDALATTDGSGNMIPNGVKGLADYSRYAVTFVDNHDTYKDGHKMTGDVVAANAYILTHPGTPCVFWKHWKSNHDEIARLIQIRKAVGVTNQSEVIVIACDQAHYVARVNGEYGSLIIALGDVSYSPSEYTDEDVVAQNAQYKIWTKSHIPALGVAEPSEPSFSAYAKGETIFLSGIAGRAFVVFDAKGQKVVSSVGLQHTEVPVPSAGVYFIKVGTEISKIAVE